MSDIKKTCKLIFIAHCGGCDKDILRSSYETIKIKIRVYKKESKSAQREIDRRAWSLINP